MEPPLDEIHPLTSQWPPGISVMPASKEFLNTFQVIQLSSPTLLDKDRSLKTWKFTWEERGHTHTLLEQRRVSFYFSATFKGELLCSTKERMRLKISFRSIGS